MMYRLRTSSRSAFTLTEMLIALAVGLVIIQIAFASFFMVQKYVNRIQRLEAATQTLQAAVIWQTFHKLGSSAPATNKNFPVALIGPDPATPRSSWTAAEKDRVAKAPQRIMIFRQPANVPNASITLYDYSQAAEKAFLDNEKIGITGYDRPTGPKDPRILAEIVLP